MSHINRDGYRIVGTKGRTLEHRLIAQAALGRPLPPKAVVHHVDGDRLNNNNLNLVICPDQAYHYLLHMRQDALTVCGNANYVRCYICKVYDAPSNVTQLYSRPEVAYHKSCRARQARETRKAKKACP